MTGWNRGAELLLGWSEDEMLGETIERIFAPADQAGPLLAKEFEQARSEGRGVGEGWRLRRSGERFWAHGEMTPLLDDAGTATGFVKVLRDRTEEHEATEALRKSEDRLRRAQEAGGVGVFSVDILAGTLEPSPQFCRIFGIPQCDLIATSEVESFVLLEDRA